MAGWLSCHSGRVILFQYDLKPLALITFYRIQGGLWKCRARKRARRRRRAVRGRGVGRGAIGGARNIDPKSAPSNAPSALPPEVEKKAEVISLSLALAAPPFDFLAGRATAINRDTRLGISARAASRTKRDTDLAASGTKLAICPSSRPGCDCRKREPVSVRGDRVPVRRVRAQGHPCGAVRIRAQARWRAARPRCGA